MSDLLPCPFCGEAPSIMSAGMAGQPRWQHPVNDTCPIAGHYLGGWDFPEQWNRRALPAVQPDAREAALREAADSLLECSVWCDSQERTDDGWRNGVTDARKHHMARILALIDKLAHVNETPKNEHDERVMLAPNAALFRGPA